MMTDRVSSPAEREARILQYWRAVELFSPQKISRLDPHNQREPVFRAGGETPLPWDSSGWFRAPDRSRKWRFTAYGGVYKLARVRAYLEDQFGKDPANFDRRHSGESCLFALQITIDGRPLLDSFVLASGPWAIGRLRNPGPKNNAWPSGFETALNEEKLRLAERFAVRENDEVGQELNRKPGVYVGRPIQPGELETEIERIAESLGVATLLQPEELRLAGRQLREADELEADSDSFLNSFFLSDLERVADETSRSNTSAALACFLSSEQTVHEIERHDVRTSPEVLWQNTSPKLVPRGRWPAASGQPLYFSQQFAVNSAVGELKNRSSPLFAINGPPGTGKTTLIRDLIASILVDRAQVLTTLKRPEDAFERFSGGWNTSDRQRSISLWREDLLGFEIVVASANNRAVENVTLEIPDKRAIAENYLPKIDYFADFATRLLAKKREGQQSEVHEAWGLIAARLGNKKNRREFMQRFWGADKEAPERRTRSQNGFHKYLKTLEPEPWRWERAVASFKAALAKEAVIRGERIAAWEAVERQKSLYAELTIDQSSLKSAEVWAVKAREKTKSARDLEEKCESNLQKAVKARRDHQTFKPGLVDALFTMGAAYREWHGKDRRLALEIEASETELKNARSECLAHERQVHQIEAEITKLTANVAGQNNLLIQQETLLGSLRKNLGPAFPTPDSWLNSANERELSSPWTDEAWDEARTDVLIEALHLHRAFIECVPGKLRQNLSAAMDILAGNAPSESGSKTVQSAWATVFFVVPVVSTTFASFGRLFSHCGRESLGWLVIDEAGQATPQSAAGALWRAKRAVVVGDPQQLEPIVTLPFTAQQALRVHFQVDETWLPSKNSAQCLADRTSRLGTWLQQEDSEEPKWVGSPLRVHRRCEQPMFAISNQIAYAGQMVYATREVLSSFPLSSWIDVRATESDGHWIPAEGERLKILLTDLIRSGASPASILLISPFRAIAQRLKDFASESGISQVGTIHVSQGKESDIVILVLGGDPRLARAKDWASEKPNLLNVAVSRAKRRLFIIGNHGEWSQYPNFSDAAALLGKEENAKFRSISTAH